MDGDTTKILLITANVGSIFEEPTQMFQPWLKAFLQEIQEKEPGVVALHCQEVGGKNYEASMQHVNQFIKNLLACDELQKYDRARIFLDEDYTAADRFTALGNLYFIHEDIDNVLIWDFVDCKFVAVEGREVLSGNIENVPIKEKAKFPQHFFPEFKWSRKGFLRTRWSINNCIFDMVNIHLFHDASNIVAMESSPSLYCGNRRRALLHTLQRFENDQYSKVPLYIFGDFNFRLDSNLLIKALTPQAVAQQTLGKKDQVNKVVYTEEGNGKVVLTVETKSFDCHEKHTDIFSNTLKWLLQYDVEPEAFRDRLFEFDINFSPSYPFTEDVNDGLSYMKTRVPSWCDRILLTHSAKDVISSDPQHKPEYFILGKETCMGDHKPVSLFVRMKPGKGKDRDSNSSVVSSNSLDIPARKRGLSINGEIVPERDLECINIHDFAVFEKEQDLIPEFRTSIKSRSSASSCGTSPPILLTPEREEKGFLLEKPTFPQTADSVARTPSFKRIAQRVRMVERVLLRWPCRPRSRHHSSSSEDYCEDDVEGSGSNHHHAVKKDKAEPDVLSVDTVVSQLSAQNIHFSLDDGEEVNSGSSPSPPPGRDLSHEDTDSSSSVPETEDSSHNKTGSTPQKNPIPYLNSSNNAQPARDINLNENKDGLFPTTDTSPNPPPGSENSGVKVPPGTGGSDTAKNKKFSENSKVVKNQAHPPAPTSTTKPECCDRDGVVHESSSLMGPRAAQVKAPTPKAELSPLPGTSDIIIPSTQVKISEVDTTRYIHIRQGQSSTRVFRETSV